MKALHVAMHFKMLVDLINQRKRYFDGAKAKLDHEGSKRQKTNETSRSVQEQPEEEEKEMSQEDLQQMMMVVPIEEVYVEALQVKYPIIDWEVYTEEYRKYWKITRVGNHTEAYQFFEDMLKVFDRDDLVMLWNLVKERFSSTEPADDKERTLWVELKRLFEPNTNDTLWKLQRYMHDPLKWRLYMWGLSCVYRERNRYFHVGRERISIVKRSSDFDVGKQTKTIKCLEASSQHKWFNSEKLVDLKQRCYLGILLGIKELLQDNAAEGLNTASCNKEGNSFKLVARTTAKEVGTSTTTILGPVTDEQKILKKNDLKARSILMMTLPSEHLLTFNKHKDVKSLFEAIEARFGGNEAIKKTQKTLLKQMYETFNASSSESLDSIFNRLQKMVSKLTILDLDSISFDDLYNNFKIVKPEVKRSVTSSSNSSSQNLAFVSGHSSTNDVNTANVHVSTSSTPVSTASTNNSTACLSDAIVYAYLATQPNGSQVVHEDLEQIHEDDLDEIDLKWQLALLKCRNPRSQENRSRSQDSSRRTVNVEESSSKAMLAIDGTGFDWSYMADEEASTNFALMAFSDFELNKSESDLDSYKKGLASVEEQLVFYKKNESMLCDQIVVLKRDALFNESDINALKKQNASKRLFAPPSIDLSNSGLEKFKQPEFEGYGVKVNKGASENVSKEVKKTSDAPIIEDWVSDCDEDETVVLESLNVQKPKQADQPRKFTPKACFVCGSFNHLIKDCDFHDKRMVQKPVLNNVKKGTGQREVRPVWTNAMRVNHQKISNSRRNFASTAVLTKSGFVPFNTARKTFLKKAVPISAARPFNTAVHKPFVNIAKPRTNTFQKTHSSLRRPFYQQTVLKNKNLNNKVNTAKVSSVNTVKGKRMTSTVGKQGINVVKPTSYWEWRPKVKMINHVYKNTGSCVCKQFNYVDPTGRNKVFNSPCFTVNSWLVQDQTVLALATLGKTATGKESSNPFMAGSLPKSISPMIHLSQKSKESHAQTLTMLMKKVKRLEDKLKFYNTSIKTRMVISDTKEYLISDDSVKRGRIEDCK
ncbi:hypothetical protein Tco_0233296 [Tanacetum coccineum]